MDDTEDRPEPITRPVTRGDCRDVPRPCPWVSCRFNLLLDVQPNGTIAFNATGARVAPRSGIRTSDEDFDRIAEAATDAWAESCGPSCALDVIDEAHGDEVPLATIAAALDVSRQHLDQLLARTIPTVRARLTKRGADL